MPTETGCAVCQPAADVPGGAEVLNKESLGPGAGGQAVSLFALTVTPPSSHHAACLCFLALPDPLSFIHFWQEVDESKQ